MREIYLVHLNDTRKLTPGLDGLKVEALMTTEQPFSWELRKPLLLYSHYGMYPTKWFCLFLGHRIQLIHAHKNMHGSNTSCFSLLDNNGMGHSRMVLIMKIGLSLRLEMNWVSHFSPSTLSITQIYVFLFWLYATLATQGIHNASAYEKEQKICF